MNDDEIINLFLKRDENGIIELSTKYHPYCYKIAWNLLANREDAEECLNDTWFRYGHRFLLRILLYWHTFAVGLQEILVLTA